MSRPQYNTIAKSIYQAMPDAKDYIIQAAYEALGLDAPSKDTLCVWRSKFRKQGIKIKDRRK
jgi:hypothetical protein